MELQDTLRLVHQGLSPYAAEHHAALQIAGDPFDVLEMFFGPVGGLRIAVHFSGSDVAGEDVSEIEHMYPEALEQIEIIVGTPIGPEAARDWRLVVGRGGRPGLIEHVQAVRALALAWVFPDDAESLRRLEYQGCEPVTTPDGLNLAAYRLRFSLHVVVPFGDDVALSLEE